MKDKICISSFRWWGGCSLLCWTWKNTWAI